MKKTTSEYITVKKSGIHNKGVFAKKNIPKGAKIIEYVGEKISKAESDRRADKVFEQHKKKKEKRGSVYIFELNSKFDLDGYPKYNTARWINHSCNPNCETININGHIWIVALRDIRKGEELSYDY
ncbi:SET domain-containing protein, partial [Candidatus Woesearchaeota archaeon]